MVSTDGVPLVNQFKITLLNTEEQGGGWELITNLSIDCVSCGRSPYLSGVPSWKARRNTVTGRSNVGFFK